MIPFSKPKLSDFCPGLNFVKTIPFTAAYTYIAYILAVIKDYGGAFKGFRQKRAPKKSSRGGQTAVWTPKKVSIGPHPSGPPGTPY